MKKILGIFLLSWTSLAFSQSYVDRKVALLDLTVRNAETNYSRVRSCRHVLKTAGLSYVETMDVAQAVQHPVVFISPVIYSSTFTSAERTLLTNYVNAGGILIASSLRDPALYPLFGVSAYTNYSLLNSMTWEVAQFPEYFERFDDEFEINVSLAGSTSSTTGFTIRPYTVTTGISMAHFESDIEGGVVMNNTGMGKTFLFALDLRDVLMRNFINSDLNAGRSYSNGFEPTTDSFIFFITNIIQEHIPHLPRVHTCPECESSVVMITHDVDSRTAMDTMAAFIDYEEEYQINAMYNITTRLYNDDWMSDFYIGSYEKVEYAKLHGQRLASHSLGHFPDFANATLFPLGSVGNTPVNYMPLYTNDTTIGGSVFGEAEVSKYLLENDHNVQVKSFRAGHLAYNPRLPRALYDLGYLYNSTFSANDVLTNFPFYNIDNLSFSGDEVPVLEIPMTISDAAACCPFTQENAIERAALWAEITIKNNNNGAPTVLLIHPNRNYKLTAEQYYVNALPDDVKFMFLDDFGDYWKKRETANVTSEYRNDSLLVYFNGFQLLTNLSLVVDHINELAGIKFFDAQGWELFPETRNVAYNETRFCHFVYSNNIEVCNGLDDDGDGMVDENLAYTQYRDLDQDGYGDGTESISACLDQLGYVLNNEDCNDGSTVIHPNNSEYCDSLDNNCDGDVDEGLDWNVYFWDGDQDGFGNDNVVVNACIEPNQFILQNGDCNDDNALINPARLEICNEIDENCNNEIDEGLAFQTYYEDLDSDGYGNDEVTVVKCILPFGFVAQHGDCSDSHNTVYPQAIEICGDNLDNNCDGVIDEGCVVDMDEDDFDQSVDCDDNNPWVHPEATEICGNGVDENCDGVDEVCPVFGCMDATALNYNASANVDDGSCIAILLGCAQVGACNYNPSANVDDGSCILPQPEMCNSLDDNCNGLIDEGLIYMNYYADNDGDGQGAGTAINACAYPGNPYISSSGDCDDNNTVVNSQAIEVCDGWDNNCNGQINEGLQTNSITSINVNTAIFPTCTTGNLFSANLNNGVNTAIIEGTGPDLWYKLTAQYNTLRVGLSAASGSNSLSIYRDFGECLQMMMTENEITSGNQTLLTDDLVVGEVYYIALHQNSSPTNASAKLCLNHLVASTCDHVYSNYTGVYNSVCSSFKAQFKTYATNYIYNVQSASQNGIDLNITPWSYNTPTSSSIVTRLGSIFPVNMSGSAKNYVLSVPVVYGLSDAAGNLEFLTANGTSTCSLTLSSEAPVVLRSADRCPNVKAINQSIQTDRSICGAIRYEWEFTQLLPIAQTPIAVLGGLNSNVLFLNAVAGMSNGKTYNVRVRPIHSNGEVGAYGGSFCMKTTGAGMMIQSNENHQVAPSLLSSEIEVSLFPNPTADGKVSLLWNMYQEDFKHLILRDAQGRIVWKTDVMVEGNLLEIDISNIQSGWYSLEVNGKLLRVVKTE